MYAYCGNDPVNKIDPNGQCALDILTWVVNYVVKSTRALFLQTQLTKGGFNNLSFSSMMECIDAIDRAGIDTPEEKAHFFAQCYVEGNLSLLEAGYLSEEKAEAYRKTKDYYPYYGAGYIQLTWSYNYKAFADYIGDPEIYNQGPKYVAKYYAWSAAGWFWEKNNINKKIANGATVKAVTRTVNGGTSQLAEREAAYAVFIAIFS